MSDAGFEIAFLKAICFGIIYLTNGINHPMYSQMKIPGLTQ